MFEKMRIACLSAWISVFVAVCVVTGSVSVYAQNCDALRQEVLRLHVVANSDSVEDQNVKLLVRDALLELGGEMLRRAEDAAQATDMVRALKSQLQQQANATLAENGFLYTAQVSVQKEYFETRTYEDVTLPAGIYMAVRVVLGEGIGQNWWCVMFPPLCLPAATGTTDSPVFTDADQNVIAAEDGYEIRFRIVEVFEELRNRYRQQKNKNNPLTDE